MLAELERLLVGFNYVVSLRLFRVPCRADASNGWYLAEALGPTSAVRRFDSATPREVLADVEYALRYEGDENAGPKPSARRSVRFRELLRYVLEELERVVSAATALNSFDVRECSPMLYPVFWGFGYVIAGPDEVLVIVGAASD
jgi:hypothetical protein